MKRDKFLALVKNPEQEARRRVGTESADVVLSTWRAAAASMYELFDHCVETHNESVHPAMMSRAFDCRPIDEGTHPAWTVMP